MMYPAYPHKRDPNQSLKEQAEAAVNKIYSAGLKIKGGIISQGGNNVMANNAAMAFDDNDLKMLKDSGDEMARLFAEIIELRQYRAENTHPTNGICKTHFAKQVLPLIYEKVVELKSLHNWEPEREPTEYDATGRPRRGDRSDGPDFYKPDV